MSNIILGISWLAVAVLSILKIAAGLSMSWGWIFAIGGLGSVIWLVSVGGLFIMVDFFAEFIGGILEAMSSDW